MVLVPSAAAVLGWLKWWHELREKRKEKEARKVAEAELEENRRRAEGPHLSLNQMGGNGIGGIPLGGILGTKNYPIPPDGTPISLIVINERGTVYDVSSEWIDGETTGAGISCTNNIIRANPRGEGSSASILYDFRIARIGRPMRIRINFATENGIRMHHDYVTRHGHAELVRTDPK